MTCQQFFNSFNPEPDFSRLETVLWRSGKPDRVPIYELFVNQETMEAVLDKAVPDRAATVEFYFRMGYDYVPAWPHHELKFGSLVDRSLGYPISDRDSFDTYPWPEPDAVSFNEFDMLKKIIPNGMKIIGQTGGVLEALEGLVGYERLCYLLIDDRSLVEAMLERIERTYEVMYTGMAFRDEVGAVVISDDLGFKTQTLISPDDLRRYILPVHKKLAAIIHDAGKPCILHSCGNLQEIMDDIIDDVKIDAKHSFEDGILPVTEAMDLYGDRVALLGGFDVDRLCRSSEEDVREYSRMLVESLGNQGGYALGSGNSIPPYVPVRNYVAMLEEGLGGPGH